MTFSRNQLIIIGSVAAVILLFAILFYIGYRGPLTRQEARLEMWGIFDDLRKVEPLIRGFQRSSPGVIINYRQFNDPEQYEKELVNAFAAGNGPDVFMFHNTWLPKHFDKIVPLPQEQLPLSKFRELFPQIAEQDFVLNGFIYALPLSVDTLALFYNRDDFNNAALPFPPKTWAEFENDVLRLRKVNPSTNEVVKAAAAIGGSLKSVNRATDLLSLLMLQYGTKMTSSDFSRASFSQQVDFQGQSFSPGLTALNLYTEFANPGSKFYTWSDTLHYSLDNFPAEGVSMIFNYAYQIPQIKQKNPFLNFGIAPMPQPSADAKAVNFPNYWGLAVSNKTRDPSVAWQFVLAAATDSATADAYARATAKPPALLSLINQYLNDPQLGVFAQQALTARSWSQIDNVIIENIFSSMIEAVTSGRESPADALREAENKVTVLMQQRKRQ